MNENHLNGSLNNVLESNFHIVDQEYVLRLDLDGAHISWALAENRTGMSVSVCKSSMNSNSNETVK